ncbi:hypothetical protein [Deinococcus cellulosilyticus]|uniref:Uncharacterized protein n=1 Tax=Deinococcus cellulosilyticus (strain DSM 18568 / NBRC 106333 / KACC 11606 / 5516J-15) TaxID=1223518 RepID=A0A511N5F7_DEIC1|nr:hypothetical protein [Deinococcus cellulosilyticus]GEM47718.1 hypothetical protein DC3_33530 [Deinococcus cellulosilyticus NBRC 106333 = KACC 11606]
MATDIHFLVQIQNAQGWEIIWKLVPREAYLNVSMAGSMGELGEWICEPFYDTRNYDLFNMLAHVRQENYELLVEPRGIPQDLHWAEPDFLQVQYPEGCTNRWGEREGFLIGEHTFSWVTLQELIEYFEFYPEYQEPAADFYSEVIPELITVASKHDLTYDQLRCVFGFDS